MRLHKKTSIFESAATLALIGVLAGAVGGLGIGLMSKPASSSNSTSSSSSSTTH